MPSVSHDDTVAVPAPSDAAVMLRDAATAKTVENTVRPTMIAIAIRVRRFMDRLLQGDGMAAVSPSCRVRRRTTAQGSGLPGYLPGQVVAVAYRLRRRR